MSQILRLMKGYDEYNTILLPPRVSGEKLPTELMEYYEGETIFYNFPLVYLLLLLCLTSCTFLLQEYC